MPLYFIWSFSWGQAFLIERCLKVAEKGKLFTELSGKETFSTALSSHPLIFGLQEDFLNHVFWLPPPPGQDYLITAGLLWGPGWWS